MSIEHRRYPEENLGALEGCLVEGDREQRVHERRRRRRSLAFSVLLQSAVLIAVVIVPLFAKTERIKLPNITPVPPYAPYRHASATAVEPPGRTRPNCYPCFKNIPVQIITHTSREAPEATRDLVFDGPQVPADPGVVIPIADARPRPLEPVVHHVDTPRILHFSNIDPAMLKRRIDPDYPALARQTHREGRVELHAIIGTDGAIQSLQVVSGDVIFYRSALAAVEQWLYKPTYLNGVPVQVDTTITVIYTMPH
jgi:TonB family protein